VGRGVGWDDPEAAPAAHTPTSNGVAAGLPVASSNRRPQYAVAVCRACPVVEDCRAYAVAHAGSRGVWGDATEKDGGS
jgi:hypothetical protein